MSFPKNNVMAQNFSSIFDIKLLLGNYDDPE